MGNIPSNATLSQVKLIYFVSGSSSYKFKVTQTSGSQSWGNLWSEIGTASALESDINYGSSSRISSSLLSAVNSARSSGVIYLGTLSQNEGSNNTEATAELRLEVTYTVPPIQVNITAQNNFIYGTIKVGVDQAATQRTSPYSFTANIGNTVNLEAQEQNYDNYYRIWNDTEAPANLSKWVKYKSGTQTEKSTSISYSFTTAADDNNSTYEGGLRKICSITFQANSSMSINGNYRTPPYTENVVEQNSVSALATSYSYNSIDFTFSRWLSGVNEFYSPITASEHKTYTAIYNGKPNNYYRNLSFNTSQEGQPIQLTWSKHPLDNSDITKYEIYRKVTTSGTPTLLTTVSANGSSTYTYTDYDYSISYAQNSILLFYDVRAYYAPSITFADPYYEAVYGLMNAKINSDNIEHNIYNGELPDTYSISNYPNPFNPTTTINYQIPENGFVTIKIYDMLGKEVTTLVNENKSAGYYKLDFDARKLSSGVYIYTIQVYSPGQANNFIQSRKMLLIR